jgi:hypothetical protein
VKPTYGEHGYPVASVTGSAYGIAHDGSIAQYSKPKDQMGVGGGASQSKKDKKKNKKANKQGKKKNKANKKNKKKYLKSYRAEGNSRGQWKEERADFENRNGGFDTV